MLKLGLRNVVGSRPPAITPPIPTLGTLVVISDTQINIPVTSSYPYEVWYSTDNGTYTKHGDSSSTPYAMTGLTFETEYWVKTRAKNGSKYSEFTPAKSQYSSLWAYKIVTDHKLINNHIPSDYYDEYYKPVLYNVLKSTYEDSEGVGYYYNTFGSDGYNNETANFFILMFIWDNITTNVISKITPADNVRMNIEGTIYNQAVIPNHTFTGDEYYIITNNNALINIYSLRLSAPYIKLHRYIPSFKYLNQTYTELWLNQGVGTGVLNFTGDVTSYVWHYPFVSALQLYDNSLSGQAPPIKGCSIFRIHNNRFTSLNIIDSIITTSITNIEVHDNVINSENLLNLVLLLNSFYSETLPTNNLILNMSGNYMGVIEGEIVADVWQENAAIIELRSYFTDAAKTLTLTYNSDELSFGQTIGIVTYDDGAITDLTETVPLLDKYNIKGTFFIIGDRAGTLNYMSWDQVRTINNNGHDIQCHTYSHKDMTTLTELQIRSQMTDNNDIFVLNSVDSPIAIAYPLYKYNDLVRTTVSEYRDIARAGGGLIGNPSYVFKDGDKTRLNAIVSDVTTYEHVAAMKLAIDGAINRKGVIIFSLHSKTETYGYDVELFDEVLNYAINEKGISFMTMKEFYTIYGDDFL